MSVSVTYKPWDSNFFGLKTGDLFFDGNASEFIAALKQLKYDGYQLLYWKFDADNQNNLSIAEEVNLFKGDTKAVFAFDVNNDYSSTAQPFEIKLWEGSISSGLIELGIASGRYSRFKNDPVFPDGSFERMYTEWVKQSLAGTMGDEIYYIGNKEQILGFTTISYSQLQAEIGLIAVDAACRKQGYGTALINFAKHKTRQHNLPVLIVATQLQNLEACKLYAHCNGQLISSEHIYHIHL